MAGSTASGNRKYIIHTRGILSMPARKYSTWNRKYRIHTRGIVSMRGRKYSIREQEVHDTHDTHKGYGQ